jgi:hypothetical protein
MVSRFAEDLRRARSQIEGFGLDEDDYVDSDDFIDTDDDGEDESTADKRRGTGSSKQKKKKKKKASARQAKGRYVPSHESDDDEEVPFKVEKMWAEQAAKAVLETSTRRKRKTDADASGVTELEDGDPIRPTNRKREREAERVANQPTKSKRAHLICDSEVEDEDEDEARPSTPQKNRKGPRFVPLPKKPLPMPEWATPPQKPSTGFTLPTSSQKINNLFNQKIPTATASAPPARNKQRKSSAKVSPQDPTTSEDSASPKPAYDESEPFIFKLIISHAD